jgi:glycosyltransferase involved in cell wall biosynthesis
MRFLTAIPIYNEERYVCQVLDEVRRYSDEILVVNDGSTDGTPQLLACHRDIHLIAHPKNRGYGAAILSAMGYAMIHRYDALVTMDCDGQHEPSRIPVLLEALGEDLGDELRDGPGDEADIVSGSRYLRSFKQDTVPPADRQRVNREITAELNNRFGLKLTDSFCGFKAYRVSALRALQLTETGWGMPLQLWVQAAHLGLRIREVAVPLLYLDPKRAFGGVLNDADQRLAYYRGIIDREAARASTLTLGGCRS